MLGILLSLLSRLALDFLLWLVKLLHVFCKLILWHVDLVSQHERDAEEEKSNLKGNHYDTQYEYLRET